MSAHILVIDDDVEFQNLLSIGLFQEGYRVTTASDGREGLRRAYEIRPDLVILDIMMPEIDGWTTCERLRNMCDTPIIILSAKTSKRDIMRGLSLYADDYVTKPCDIDVLSARIETILRRSKGSSPQEWRTVFDDGNLRIDLSQGMVTRRGRQLHLAPTESRLLMYLVSQRGRIVPQRELLVNVWGPECADEVGYLSVYIRYLRKKLEDDPARPEYIRTLWGVGYYFVGRGQQELSA